jgi:NitT/TauT family transport system substrate-binding protein
LNYWDSDIRTKMAMVRLLGESGPRETDNWLEMSPQAAPQWFGQFARSAVTFEPRLTPGKNIEYGHLLTDTSKQSGLIADCLETTVSAFGDSRKEFRAFGCA